MLESGRVSTIRELSSKEKVEESYLGKILRLTLLAPDIVKAILDGRQLEDQTVREAVDVARLISSSSARGKILDRLLDRL